MRKSIAAKLIAALAAACALVAAQAAIAAAPVIATDSGPVSGSSETGLDVFKGVPFASPPVGPLRWKPPQPPAPWSAPRQATQFGAACPQPSRGDGVGGGVARVQSEDCLTLNVWAPHGAKGLPVMVWIYGGGHRVGASSFPIYDGAALAKQGVVLVSINYRLGLLGYFAHPALTAEVGPNDPLGNYGFLDQVASLEWVKRNIAAFGGDPGNVTVFGESAGGASILFLLTSARSKSLFQKAIVESGGGLQFPQGLAAEEEAGVTAAGRIGLPANATADQLRAQSADKWLEALGGLQGLGFGPFIDGRAITEAPASAFRAGRAMDVPLMIGANSNEASVLAALGAPPGILAALAAGRMETLQAAYGGLSEAELPRQALGDALFVGPARFVAGEASKGAPSYLYHFDYVAKIRRGMTPGAGHGSEIPYVFQSWTRLPIPPAMIADEDRRIATLMSGCWTSFARTGAPACPGGPAWPAYDPVSDQTMVFGEETSVQAGFRKRQLDFVVTPQLRRLP